MHPFFYSVSYFVFSCSVHILVCMCIIKYFIPETAPQRKSLDEMQSFDYIPIIHIISVHLKGSRICDPKICHFGM